MHKTMHLQQGLSTINTRLRKTKLTKAKLAELEVRWRKHNKEMKLKHLHDMRYDTLDEYINYCYGKQFKKQDARSDRSHYRPEKSYAQQRIEEFNKKYPSVAMTSNSKGDGIDAKWQLEKQKISSSYTVAPAYNKGAYQVVPRNEIKHIGK